jgi:hypothetical protein
MAPRYQHDPRVLHRLLHVLAVRKKFGEALYLAFLGNRMGWLRMEERVLREIALEAFIRSLDEDSAHLEFFAEQLASWASTESDEETLALLVYLLAQMRADDALVNVRYQAPAFESALQRFPELFGFLLADRNVSVDESIEGASVARARTSLREFEHGQKKRSCYSNWTPAERYQEGLRGFLEKQLREVRRGTLLAPVNVEAVIDNVQSRFNLARARGDARKAMVRHLEKQLNRLRDVAEGLRCTSFETLTAASFDEGDGIEREAQSVGGGPLRTLYDKMLDRDED